MVYSTLVLSVKLVEFFYSLLFDKTKLEEIMVCIRAVARIASVRGQNSEKRGQSAL